MSGGPTWTPKRNVPPALKARTSSDDRVGTVAVTYPQRASASDSVFHASGLVYAAAKAFYGFRVPGGADAFAASMPPGLLAFWSQNFIAASRYDILPILDLSAHAARLCRISHMAMVTESSRWTAKRDVNGVYRLLLRVMSPSMTAVRLPKAAGRYFDFGKATAHMTAPHACRCTQSGLPAPLVDWFVAATTGFCDVALCIAGAHDVTVREVTRIPEGSRGSMPTVTLAMHLSWKE
jgi:hypothetical protein